MITGANRGIGFEAARQLAIRGFHVVSGVRSEQHGQTAVTELERLGKASLLLVDVSDSKSIAFGTGNGPRLRGSVSLSIVTCFSSR